MVTAAFVIGRLLDSTADLDRIELALVVAEAPKAVPWMSRPAHLEALASVLGFHEAAGVVALASGGVAGLEP